MNSFVAAADTWILLACIVAGAAMSIWLEQTYKWAAKLSGPVVALLLGMALSNSKLLPTDAPGYGVIEDFLVPVAIPLLIFRANIVRILRETGPMFLCFHIASIGTVLGAFLAAFIFRGAFARVPEITGIMTGSYIGGGVNFFALKQTYNVSDTQTTQLLVADNFIMAGMFAVLLVLAGNRLFRRWYPHPHSLAGDKEDVTALAAKHWRPKEVSLLDTAKALAVAFVIVAAAKWITGALKGQSDSKLLGALFGNAYLVMTILSVTLTTLFHKQTEKVQGAEDLGMYLLYLFFVVIGLRADFFEVAKNAPVLFLFCLVIAVTNLAFTLAAGKLLKQNLEELLLSVNATLGGAPSAAAMAISRGWTNLVVPGLLAGIWGYIIGTFIGILVTESLFKLLAK